MHAYGKHYLRGRNIIWPAEEQWVLLDDWHRVDSPTTVKDLYSYLKAEWTIDADAAVWVKEGGW